MDRSNGNPDEATLTSLDGASKYAVREYQQELLEQARTENVIVYLETGAGKTLIAALLAKDFIQDKGGKVIIMLVPTKVLVEQQADLFRKFVAGEVGEYTGDRFVDDWNHEKWREELRTHSILVMTPKILEDRLVCKQVSFWDICLLILDEAHHCSGQHSYAQIMQMYGEAAKPDRPHILGMTASPVKTAATTKEKLTTYLLELEKRMHSKLITIQGQALQKLHETVPMPVKGTFDFALPSFSMAHQENVMIMYSLQQLIRDEGLLELMRQYTNLQRKKQHIHNLKEPGNHVSLDDRGPLTRAEGVGHWLVHKFGFALIHQGPFCAALILQDYFRNCSSDGRLSTLGCLGEEKQFYAAMALKRFEPKAKRRQYVATDEERRKVIGDLNAVMQRIAAEQPHLRGVQQPSGQECLRTALLHAVLLCVRMLVSDPALADCLGAQARQLLFAREPPKKRRCHPPESAGTGTAPPDSAYADTHMHAVAAVLDAALHAVPSAVLEAYVLPDHSTRSTHGPQSPAVRAWRRRMRCDLVMDKVCKALEKLYLACAEATALDPGSKWAAIVFAERQTCSLAMDMLVKRVPKFAKILKTGYLKSENSVTSKTNQGTVIANFRNGSLNALFSTSVAEEGLDIQQCSLVICYDVPKRPLSMVQTVGRARAKDSRVFFMQPIQDTASKQQDNIQNMTKYNDDMHKATATREALDQALEARAEAEQPREQDTVWLDNKAVNASRARSMLAQYCQALLQWKARWQGVLRGHKSADRRAREMQLCRPRESTAKVGDGTAHEYEVTLHLPTSAPVRHITGERRGTRAAAKDSAVLRMICALWDRGAFDGFLRPMAPPELLAVEQELNQEDSGQSEWASRQTLRQPPSFVVPRQPPLHLDVRVAPLDESAACGDTCFVSTHLHLYTFHTRPGPGAAGAGCRLQLCLGLLLLQRLPELPWFTVYEAPRGEGQPGVAHECRLQYTRTVDLSMEQLVKAQRFHCKMVQTACGGKGIPDPLSPDDTVEAMSNETWAESAGGAYYVIVPVCAAAEAAGSGKARKTRHDASPRLRTDLDVDERTIASALHPAAEDDGAADEIHAQVMQLLHKRLDDSAGAEQQAEAQVEMQELLAGRVLTTLHQPKMAYRFRGISGATIGDKFPDDRHEEYGTFLDYYTRRYDYKPDFFNPRAPLLRVTVASSAVKDINPLLRPRPLPPGGAAAAAAADTAADAATAEVGPVDPEGVPVATAGAATDDRVSLEAAQAGLAAAAIARTPSGSADDVIDLASSSDGDSAMEATAAADAPAAPPRPRRPPRSILLPLEVCRVHRLRAELLQSLQFLPGLIYRVEGLLTAHEMWLRLAPPWMPEAVRRPDFTLRVLEALTPQGTRDSLDSERLELLGDGVLKGAAAKYVFRTCSGSEGMMSLALCHLVSNGTLFRVAVWTKDVESPTPPEYSRRTRDARSVTESIRAFAYDRALWRPPGFERHAVLEEVTLGGKKAADALEALIAVVFEAAGDVVAEAWLAYLGILPKLPIDPRALKAMPVSTFLDDVKAAAAESVEVARAVPKAAIVGANGKATMVPAPVQMRRSSGRAGADVEETPLEDAEENPQQIEAETAAERRNLPKDQWLESQFKPLCRLPLEDETIQQKLRAIIPSPDVLLQMNECLRVAPQIIPPPPPAVPPPELQEELRSHLLGGGGWRAVQQQRRVARGLAAAAAAAAASAPPRTFRPREVQEVRTRNVQDILGYSFNDIRLMRSSLIHSSFKHEQGDQDRLEFLGDAMLGTCVTAFLFHCLGADRRQEVRPEQMHNLRAMLVQNDTLAFLAVVWGLDRHLQYTDVHLGKGIAAFREVVDQKLLEKEQHPHGRNMGIIQYLLTAGGWDMQTLDHPKALGDVLEATIGAVAVDCNYDMPAILKVVLRLMDGLRGVSPDIVPANPVSVLYEAVSKLAPGVQPVFEYQGEEDAAAAATGVALRGRASIALPGGAAVESSWCSGASRRKIKALCAEDLLRRLADRQHAAEPAAAAASAAASATVATL